MEYYNECILIEKEWILVKKIIFICFIIFICLFISMGCKNKNKEIEVVENFLNSFYTVSDISDFDSKKHQINYPDTEFDNSLNVLTAKDAFNKIINNRLSLLVVMGAYNNKFNTSVENISIKKYTESDNGTVYNYSLDLCLKYIDKNKTVKENIKGQLTVSKIEVNDSEKLLISKINKLPIPKSFLSKNK